MKQSTKDFIEQLLWREIQAEEGIGYEERNEYVEDLIDAYVDFQKYYYKNNWIMQLALTSREELEKKIYD